jgi:TonB-dependent starch-binding outer membrane protein SusC
MYMRAVPSTILLPAAVVALLLAAAPAVAQQGTVVGSLLDQNSLEALSTGTVSVVGAGIEVRLDPDGSFVLPAVKPGSLTIRVTSPGYANSVDQVEVAPDEVTFVQFQLLPVSATLSEVLVISRRRAGTTDGVEVPTERNEMALTAADLLARQVPGLSYNRSHGVVGSGSRISIRGISTIAGSNDPIVFVDGVRINENSGGGSGRTRAPFAALDQIPASNVKRIRVLRGASAAARYADSANGVILIETHTGSQN